MSVPEWEILPVSSHGNDLVLIVDNGVFGPLVKWQAMSVGQSDFLERFYASSRSRTRATRPSLPQLRFANAARDSEQVQFTQDFGPVLARWDGAGPEP
jgi:hypothetical protein